MQTLVSITKIANMINGSYPGIGVPMRNHLVIYGYIDNVKKLEGRATGIQWVEGLAAAELHTMHKRALKNRIMQSKL